MRSFNQKSRASQAKVSGSKTKAAGQAVQLEICLLHIKPRIWRDFVVPGNIKLHRLHEVIQAVMGWTNSHLHAFRVGNYEYLPSDPEEMNGPATSDTMVHDERKYTLRDLIETKGDKFTYGYDFGDDWEHVVKVKSITLCNPPLKSSFCNAGERACPPEDCGGAPGYSELCAALGDPTHPEHTRWKDSIGDYDPNCFVLDDANLRLRFVRI